MFLILQMILTFATDFNLKTEVGTAWHLNYFILFLFKTKILNPFLMDWTHTGWINWGGEGTSGSNADHWVTNWCIDDNAESLSIIIIIIFFKVSK